MFAHTWAPLEHCSAKFTTYPNDGRAPPIAGQTTCHGNVNVHLRLDDVTSRSRNGRAHGPMNATVKYTSNYPPRPGQCTHRYAWQSNCKINGRPPSEIDSNYRVRMCYSVIKSGQCDSVNKPKYQCQPPSWKINHILCKPLHNVMIRYWRKSESEIS